MLIIFWPNLEAKLGDEMLTYWKTVATLHFADPNLQDSICLRIVMDSSRNIKPGIVLTHSCQAYSVPCAHLRRGGISFDVSKTLQQSGGIIMGASSPAVAGSYSPSLAAQLLTGWN